MTFRKPDQRASLTRIAAAAIAPLAIAPLAIATLAIGTLAAPASAQTPAPAAAPLPTQAFVQALATLAVFEQRAGKLAQVLGQSNDVRRYGRDLAEDQKMLQTLDQGLAAAEIAAPAVTTLPPNEADLLATLNRVDAREFDRMFADLQAQAHREALSIVRTYAEAGENPAIKATAARLAPVFQRKLSQALSVQKIVG